MRPFLILRDMRLMKNDCMLKKLQCGAAYDLALGLKSLAREVLESSTGVAVLA